MSSAGGKSLAGSGSTGAPKRRPTIRDVAEIAGVSRGTVSRVLNGHQWVSAEALDAVTAAIESIGYSANQHARSLVTGRANSFAFLLTEPSQLLFDDPNFSVLLRNAAETFSQANIPLLLMMASTPNEQAQILKFITAGHVDGVLLVSSRGGTRMLKNLLKEGVPTVVAGIPRGFEEKVSWVAADDAAGARMMTEHLIARGRRRVATITGPLDTSGGALRLEGFRAALGSQFAETRVAQGDWSRDSGRAAMEELLERDADIDAVFVASDLMAVGALDALRAAGRSVPEDVAVGGFDDSGLAETLSPPLTTIRQPLERVSAEMVRLLTGLVDGETTVAVTVPTTLVVREST